MITAMLPHSDRLLFTLFTLGTITNTFLNFLKRAPHKGMKIVGRKLKCRNDLVGLLYNKLHWGMIEKKINKFISLSLGVQKSVITMQKCFRC